MGTSKADASRAAKLLGKATTPKVVKSVAGSDLAQTKRTPKVVKGMTTGRARAKRSPRK